MVGRWTPGRVFGRSDWWALPPRVWALAGMLAAVVLCFLVPFGRGQWSPAARSHVRRCALFLGYMMLAATWSRAGSYAGEKAVLLALILIAVVLAAKLTHDTGAWMARAFWGWMAAATTAYALYTAGAGWSAVRGRGERLSTPLGGGPNVFGRITAILTLLGITYGTRGAAWVLWYGPAALAIVLTVATGSRGGLLALVVASLAMAEARGVFRRRGILPAAVLVSLLVVAFSMTRYWDRATAVFEQRVIKMTFEKRDDSGRTEAYTRAWNLGTSAPFFGSGLAGFRRVDPVNEYPHNLFLESFAEGGLIGVGLVTALLWGAARNLARDRHTDLGTVTWAAFVAMFVASQFSGDLFDTRLLFILPALQAESPQT